MGTWQDSAYFQKKATGDLLWHEPRFADLYADGAWTGDDVWIIGGGPSVKSHDLSRLHGRKVIAVNMGFTVCEPTFVFVGSVLLLQRLAAGARRVVLDVHCPLVVHERAVWNLRSSMGGYVLEVADQRCPWGRTLKEGVPAFSNSGLMALNIADILGADRVFLVGFDMRPAADGRTANFHAAYPVSMRPTGDHYETYMDDFRRVPEHCRAPVFNCSPDSRLTVFPKVAFEEALA